jgi:hypothetical protein
MTIKLVFISFFHLFQVKEIIKDFMPLCPCTNKVSLHPTLYNIYNNL